MTLIKMEAQNMVASPTPLLTSNDTFADPYLLPLPLPEFCVVLSLSFVFLLGLPLCLLAMASIVARSANRQVDVVDTYVLNGCLAYVWMLLFSLLPYLIGFLTKDGDYVFGRLGCFFLPFLRRYPVYVLSALYVGLAVHACRGATGGRKEREWRSRLAVCVAWMSGLLAVMEIYLHGLADNGRGCTEDRQTHAVLFYGRTVTWSLVTWFLPSLSVFILFPMACCYASRDAAENNKKRFSSEEGFPIYRLDSRPQPSFKLRHVSLAACIGFLHCCCMGPLVCLQVIHTIDTAFLSESYAVWLAYFECAHFGPAVLVPCFYIVFSSATNRK